MTRECNHPPCRCQGEEAMMFSKDGGFYCSDTCARQPDTTEECICGHAECEHNVPQVEPTET